MEIRIILTLYNVHIWSMYVAFALLELVPNELAIICENSAFVNIISLLLVSFNEWLLGKITSEIWAHHFG